MVREKQVLLARWPKSEKHYNPYKSIYILSSKIDFFFLAHLGDSDILHQAYKYQIMNRNGRLCVTLWKDKLLDLVPMY